MKSAVGHDEAEAVRLVDIGSCNTTVLLQEYGVACVKVGAAAADMVAGGGSSTVRGGGNNCSTRLSSCLGRPTNLSFLPCEY